MTNSIIGYCGTVSQDGKIVSNGNFSCISTVPGIYDVSYNKTVFNPVPIVTLNGNNVGYTFTMTSDSDGFTISVIDKDNLPASTDFNFIVSEIA